MNGVTLTVCLTIGAGMWSSAAFCRRPAPEAQTSPRDTLVAGCAGGITGGGSGSAVTGTGDLLRWIRNGPRPEETEWTQVGRDPTKAQRIYGRLGSTDFDQTEFRHPSNMTCFLARRGPKPHEVAWPMGQRPANIIKIVALFDQLQELAKTKE